MSENIKAVLKDQLVVLGAKAMELLADMLLDTAKKVITTQEQSKGTQQQVIDWRPSEKQITQVLKQ